MKYHLVVPARENEPARELLIQQDDFLIGRDTDCDLRLSDSTISRHHCILHVSGHELTVIDLGSSNGTYLNGQRVRSQAVVPDGAEVSVGSWKFHVSLGVPGRNPGDDPTGITYRPGRLPRT